MSKSQGGRLLIQALLVLPAAVYRWDEEGMASSALLQNNVDRTRELVVGSANHTLKADKASDSSHENGGLAHKDGKEKAAVGRHFDVALELDGAYAKMTTPSPTPQPTVLDARAYARQVAEFEWNWVLIKLNSASDLPADHNVWFYGFGAVDVKVKAKAWSSQGGSYDADLGTRLFEVTWRTQEDTANPVWDHIGVVAFEKGSASDIELTMWDVDHGRDDLLMTGKVPIPSKTDSWGAEQELQGSSGAKLRFQMWFRDEPLVSHQEQQNMYMDLNETIFSLERGDTRHGADKASLMYKKVDGNSKAIFYIPGREDTFMHPHVLQLFLDNDFDLYTLDSRRCGRCIKYLDDPRMSHHSDDFDEYFEEFDLALNFMKAQKDYTKVVGYTHSTGAPMLVNYIMKNGDDAFSAFIMNGPFLDWGHGAPEAVLDNAAGHLLHVARYFGEENPVFEASTGISTFNSKIWLNYRQSFDARPLVAAHVTVGWCAAVSAVHSELGRRAGTGVTTKPTFVISSKADTVLEHEESVVHASYVNKNPVIHQLTHNSHDVTLSVTSEYNEEALKVIDGFLKQAS